jgi:hypothetical protein
MYCAERINRDPARIIHERRAQMIENSTPCRESRVPEGFWDTEEHGLRAALGPSGRQKLCTWIESVLVRVLPCPGMFGDPFLMNKAGSGLDYLIYGALAIGRN